MSENFIPKLIEDIAKSEHTLARIPESSNEMSGNESVHDFNELMRTNLTVNYAASMDFIHRVRTNDQASGGSVLDLCSGPGHYSACLAKYLGFSELTGIDLSQPMVDLANTNVTNIPSHVRTLYKQGNALNLSAKDFIKFDVVTFVNAAHHFNSINDVRRVLSFADEACSEHGVVLLTDLCRLPTSDVSDRFITMIGEDYIQCGLPALAEDFRASMYAAWSPEEMKSVAPANSKRTWYQIVSGAFPFFQAVVGLPVGRDELFIRNSKEWSETNLFQTERARSDWELTKSSYYNGLIRQIKDSRTATAQFRKTAA
jgi:2-polyprenyl-3-methyl-5-hydroxy-6-metoxy-1,4-benzoquinol methylase